MASAEVAQTVHELDAEATEQLVNRIANFVEAFGHPLRLRVMAWAYGHPDERLSPQRVATAIGTPLPLVSYHVRKLRDGGFLRLMGERPVRGAVEHFYAITPRGRCLLERVSEVLGCDD